jgi:hypothetical protein
MRQQGLTQEEVAAKLGVSGATIFNWESQNGDTSNSIVGNACVPEPPDQRLNKPRVTTLLLQLS